MWSQYFRDRKTEGDLIKERAPFLLKRKLSIIFSKDSDRKEYTSEKKWSRRKSYWDNDLKNHIEEILNEDSDLEVNEIKERFVEKDTSLLIQLCENI